MLCINVCQLTVDNNTMNGVMILLAGGFILGILLTFVIIKKNAKSIANRILAVFLVLISTALLGRTQYEYPLVKSTLEQWGWLIDELISIGQWTMTPLSYT